MPNCAPQRYLGNDRNLVRTATLTPSSVFPVANSVIEQPVARVGTAQVKLAGSYTGTEPATYDVEIVDDTATDKLISAPVFSGAGSGTLSNISASAAAQEFVVQLANAGIPTLAAGLDFEGVRIVARNAGAGGNDITIDIDQSGLAFAAQPYSLLVDLPQGTGAPTAGIEGSAFDWDTKVLGADNIIPSSAHRVSFGDDRAAIYLQYKRYVGGVWLYHFVPEIKRDIPKGTRIYFVTGGRDVTITDASLAQTETHVGMVTVYDLLNSIKTTSTLVNVEGVVAFDRSPTGQAAKELLARTDAHVLPTTGTGSAAARGFENTFANAQAATELVTAVCYAITSQDHPLARLGAERWALKGSVSGDLGDIVTGVDYLEPNGRFGLRIPSRLPPGYGQATGRFTHVDTNYVPRTPPATEPPICMKRMQLGSEAVDQTITLRYKLRPTGNCACESMLAPRLNPRCLGLITTEGGTDVGYQADTIARLVDLYDWQADTVRANSSFANNAGSVDGRQEAFVEAPQDSATSLANFSFFDGRSLLEVIGAFESALAEIDAVSDTTLRTAGNDAWDIAVTELKYDVDAQASNTLYSIPSTRYTSRLQTALISAGIPPLGKTDASILESGDGCWRDYGDAYWWEVVGSDKGAYAPAFTNQPYHLARRAGQDGKFFSTKEGGFVISVKCPQDLVEDDEIILVIGDAGHGSTYQVGDELTVPIVAAQPLALAGGQDGNAILDWYVTGSVDGPLPNFSYDPNTPAPYSAGGLAFTYTPGGIPNAKGDSFVFRVEGGHYRWRKNGGAWVPASPPESIVSGAQSFDSGLTIEFVPGAAPSYVPGDVYSFKVLQPWAVSNLRRPVGNPWKWSGATPTQIFDFGSNQTVSGAAIARHTLPTGSTLVLEFGTVAGVYDPSTEALTWQAGEIVKEFAPRTARYVRLSITGATDASIDWAWLGDMLTTSLSAEVDLRKAYRVNQSGGGLDQGGRYMASGMAGDITWSVLSQADTDAILAMVDHAKSNGDEPILLVPNIGRPLEAYLQRVAVDDVDLPERSGHNRDPAYQRSYSLRLAMAPVWKA